MAFILSPLDWATAFLFILAIAGIWNLITNYFAIRWFLSKSFHDPEIKPPITLLKPLYGAEPKLFEALQSFCQQDYPQFQIVFGVRYADDEALDAVRRLQAAYPHIDMEIVIDERLHGMNRKVSNLINMMAVTKYDLLVITDSDMHVPHDYLARVVAGFSHQHVGLVTSLYTGAPTSRHLSARLGSLYINHGFLPAGLVGARHVSRQDCFGATMALWRSTLEEIGGFEALVSHLADDFVLGQRVRACGYDVALAPVLPTTTVDDVTFESLFVQEMRWARTIRSIAPWGYTFSIVQFPTAFAFLACVTSGFATCAIVLLLVSIAVRCLNGYGIDRHLELPPQPVWLMPIRDILSFGIMLASFLSRRVEWRGHSLMVAADGTMIRPALGPDEIVIGD